ncbi:MAG: tripartite tricarboxylate transporter TctB family protein [Candidatus Methylomirabilota bacterium]
MRTLRTADMVTGGLTIALGLVTILTSQSITAMAGESLDPRTLPVMVGSAMILCGAGIVFTGWRYRGDPVPVNWPDTAGVRRLVVTAVLLFLYVALIEPIGFPIVTAAFVAAHTWYLGRYRPWTTVLGGVVCGVVVYYVFMEALELTFPLGLLEYLLEYFY